MMKNIVVLYAGSVTEFAFDKCFAGKSAFDLSLEWASRHGDKTYVLCGDSCFAQISSCGAGAELVKKSQWTNEAVACEISALCGKNSSDFAIFSWADTPFLNDKVTDELVFEHTEYEAEYSFADGFPYGIAPEIISAGTAGIVAALAKDSQKEIGAKSASRDGIFSVMKGDINSFEIETLISDKDYRMLRLEFECSSKINFLACKNLFEKVSDRFFGIDAYRLCDEAEKSVPVIKTVPAFYNIQITPRYNHQICYNPKSPVISESGEMNLSEFRKLVSKISLFSDKAVISLSCFGEPLLHSDFSSFVNEILSYDNLSVLVETDGILANEKTIGGIDIQKASGKIDWIILLDAMDSALYSELHSCPESDFSLAVNSVPFLEARFPGHVWPQFVRMKKNEPSLESFYRFWKEKENPSHGKLIIQKYDSFAGLLLDEKSADLAPLKRNPCWHLRRDMTILCDGTVPICRDQFGAKLGNVFAEELDEIWKRNDLNLENHLCGNYSDKCKACDEYYTFIF